MNSPSLFASVLRCLVKRSLLAAGLLLSGLVSFGQAFGSLDLAFNPGAGANSDVHVVRVQSDGKVIVGGDFTLFAGAGHVRLARLEAGGGLDPAFGAGTGFNGWVEDVAIQADGKILVAGSFTTANGATRNYLARLLGNGSLDSAFDAGVNQSVQRILIQPDGKIVIGGSFSEVGGQPRARVARLNADGTLDVGFNSPGPLSGTVNALGLQADGKIVAGGSFHLSHLGIDYYYLIRMNTDGSLEQHFNANDRDFGLAINSTVQDLIVQPDQRILIAGHFTSVRGESRRFVARLMPSGRVDGTFNPGSGPNGAVRSIARQADGKVILGGDFTEVASAARRYVARLNATGALDTTFDPGVGPNARVESVVLTAGGNVLIGGVFETVAGVGRNRVARLTGGSAVGPGAIQVADVQYRVVENAGSITVRVRRLDGSAGAVAVNYETGTGATAGSAEVISDFLMTSGTLNWAAGDTSEKEVLIPIIDDGLTEIEESFTLILSAPTGGAVLGDADTATIVIVNDDSGILDTAFDSGLGVLGVVKAVAIEPGQADGKVIVGGNFTWVLNENRNRLARLNANGTLDMTFNIGSGANSDIEAVQLQADGKILIGGSFTTFNGSVRNYFARLNSNGSVDQSFNPGVNSTVNEIVIQNDGKILIGGSFSEVNGQDRDTIARLNSDGSLDLSFQPPNPVSGSVYAIAIEADGSILAGGSFSAPHAGLTFYYLMRLSPTGNIDPSFNFYTPEIGQPINSSVQDIAVQPDGRILIGGDFTSVRGVGRGHIARLFQSGDLDATFVTAGGANGSVRSIGLQPNGQVMVGGWFTQVASATRKYLARFNVDGSLDTGFDPIAGPDDRVNSMVLAANGKAVLGGEFRRFSSFPRGGVARILNIVSPPSPGAFQVGSTIYRTIEGGTALVEVRRINGVQGAVSVNYNTVSGTAGAGTDFTAASGVLNWANGDSSSKFVPIATLPDGLVEAEERFTFVLSGPTGAAGLSEAKTAEIAITDDDPGLLSQNFVPLGILGNVEDLAVQLDGKVVIVGDFSWVGEESRNRVARLTTVGALDMTFNPGTGANGTVRAVAIQPDGKILIGGAFSTVDGQSRTYLARFDSNGSLDGSFNPGFDGQVDAILLQADGDIVVGGTFSHVNGEFRGSLVRLNTDGSIDMGFNPVRGISGAVRSIARQADGRYVVGGSFSVKFDGETYYYLIRLGATGLLDETFNQYDPAVGIHINSTVESVAIQTDQKILIGGHFTAVHQAASRHFGRLNTDGTRDATFVVGDGANAAVFEILLQADGRILLGGAFTEVQDTARRRVARLNPNGSLDSTLDPGVGPNGPVVALAHASGGEFFIGGSFTAVNGFPRRAVALLRGGGTAPGTVALGAATFTVEENGGQAKIGVTRTGGGAGSVSMAYATSNGTAGAADYTSASGTLFWGEGDVSTKFILVNIANDAAVEVNETFNIQLSNPTGGVTLGAPASAVVTIIDNSAVSAGVLQMATANYRVSEDGGSIEVTVTRTGGTGGVVQVNYATANGTATSGADYSAQTGTLTFQNGQSSARLRVPISNDLAAEADETFTITLSAPGGGATIGAVASTTVTIVDNDLNPVAGGVDLAFNPGAGANDEVHVVVRQSDGKILAGGEFTQFNGSGFVRIVRMEANGGVDGGFNPGTGFNNTVEAIAVQSDGKILVGGHFTLINGTTRNYLARLEANGSLDGGFNAGVDGVVNSIVIQPNGKFLIGGSFNNVASQPRRSVARLNADGTLDSTFNSPAGGAAHSLALQTDGKILMGGSFSFAVKGRTYYYLARLNSDGSLEENFNPYDPSVGPAVNSSVRAIVVQPDGRILIGGDFNAAGNVSRPHVARLLADGTIDLTFDPGAGANGAVYDLELQPDGKVILAGNFSQVALSERQRVARLLATGSLDTTLEAEVGPANSIVRSLVLLPTGRILIAGRFETVNGVARNGVAMLNGGSAPSGGAVQMANVYYRVLENAGAVQVAVRRLDGGVGAVTVRYATGTGTADESAEEVTDFVATSGELIWLNGDTSEKTISIPIVNDARTEVEENFTIELSEVSGGTLGVADTATITIVNDDPGMLDLAFNPAAGVLGTVNSVAVQPDGKVIAVGDFQWALGVARNRIARFNNDGTLDLGFDPGTGASGTLETVALQADGKVLIGGSFNNFNGTPRNNLARLDANGALDAAFTAGADQSVQTIIVDAGGKILIGGPFDKVNGLPQSGIAVLNVNGSLDAAFVSSPTIGGTVYAIARQPDGKILIGGNFNITSAGATYYYLARLNANGSVETGFNVYNPNVGLPINSTVQTLLLQSNGRILIGGDFTAVHGESHQRVARLMPDGSLDGTFQVGAGANNSVRALALQADGKVILGGRFTTVAAARRTYLARLNLDGSVDVAFDPVSINKQVASLAPSPGGKFVLGGEFTSFNSFNRGGVARINPVADIPSPGSFQFAATEYFPSESAGSVQVTVRRLDGNVGPVSVAFATSNGGAEAGVDYTANSGVFNWLAGDTTDRTITINLSNDATVEEDETFFVTLSLPTGGAGLGEAFRTIVHVVNDDLDGGLLDLSFAPNLGANARVHDVAVDAAGKVVIGGEFTQVNGVARNRIARLNSDGSLDLNFDPGSGANSTVESIAIQADGKILMGGSFTAIDGVTRNYFARLNSDASLDESFSPGVDSTVNDILVEDNAQILIAGAFSEVNGVPSRRVARLHADASLDLEFQAYDGINGSVQVLAKRSDGSILIGGSFNITAPGRTIYYLAHLSSTGQLDPLFNYYDPSVGSPINSSVRAIALQPDDRILIGGDFTSVHSQNVQRIARLMPDGSHDGTFHPGTGANNSVNAIVLQPDGRVVIGGQFTQVAGQTRNRIARLNSDGTLELAFDPGAGPNAEIDAIVLMGNGKMVVGGEFTQFSSYVRHRIARLNSVPSLPSPGSVQVSAVNYQIPEGAGSIAVGVRRIDGSLGAVTVNYVMQNGTATGADYSATSGTIAWGDGESGEKQVIIPIIGDGNVEGFENFSLKLSAPGGGLTLGAAAQATITIVDDEPGILNLEFDPGAEVFGNVEDLAVQNDGKVIIGGDFTWVWGENRNRIARLNVDGSLDWTFNPGSGANSTVHVVAVQADGKILIAGNFTAVNGEHRSYLARFDSNGSLDPSFNVGIDAQVTALLLQSDGDIVIGGNFGYVNGERRDSLARLNSDGSLDLNFHPVNGINGPVRAIARQADNRYVIGGSFSVSFNSEMYYYLIRLNASGLLDETFNQHNPAQGVAINSTVEDIAVQPDQKILIAGHFTAIRGETSQRIGRLNPNGTRDTTFAAGSGANGVVEEILLQADGKILMGGNFTVVQAVGRGRVARLNGNGLLDSTLDPGIGANGPVVALAHAQGRLDGFFIGGGFSSFNGFPRQGVALLRGGGTAAGTLTLDAPSYTVSENAGHLVVSVSRSGDGAGSVTVDYNAGLPGSATAADFNTVSGTLFWGDGDMAPKMFLVPILYDPVVESDETFTVQLSNPTGGAAIGVPASAVVTILDNSHVLAGELQFASATYNASEDAGMIEVTVNRTIGVGGIVQVNYATANGTASGGADFTTQNSTLVFANGQVSQRILIPIQNDLAPEPNETFTITLSAPGGGATIGPIASTTVTILDNDLNPIAGGLDVTFDPSAGANGEVHRIVRQNDGKILAGGEFTLFNGATVNRIVRMEANGSVDPGFSAGTGFNSTVEAITVQADGKILVGGSFSQVNTVTRNNLARLNSNGSLDAAFNPAVDGAVNSILIQPDGKILLGGSFDNVGGQPRRSVARLNADGTLDAAFNAPIDGAVITLALQPDGKILAGGSFSFIVRGRTYYYLARLNNDGSLEDAFNPYDPQVGLSINSSVRAIVVQPDGRILIGGDFTTAGYVGRARVARLLADGTIDLTFDPGAGVNNIVHDLALQSDGKVIVGGNFSQVAVAERDRVARLHATGALDTMFEAEIGPDNRSVRSLVLLPGGSVLIAGDFETVDGTPRNRVAMINGGDVPSGGTVQMANTGYRVLENAGSIQVSVRRLDGGAGAITLHYETGLGTPSDSAEIASDYSPVSGDLLWIHGDTSEKNIIIPIVNDSRTEVDEHFTITLSDANGGALGQPETAIITIVNDDPGMLDLGFNPGEGTLGGITALAIQPDGKVIAVGDFQWARNQSRGRIARFNVDGALDLTFDPGSGANGLIESIALQADGKILIGGQFTSYNGTGRNNFARLNNNGALDAPFNPGVNGQVLSIIAEAGGSILIGGNFAQVNSQPRERIARLNADGSLNASFTPPPFSGGIFTMAAQADGRILVGGNFSLTEAGITYYYLARLNANGTLDYTFNKYDPNVGIPVNSTVRSIAVQPDQRILIGGDFTTAGNTSRRYFARLLPDGSIDNTFQVGSGANNRVEKIALQSNGKVLIAGFFTEVADAARNRIARLNADGSLDTTFDPVAGPDGPLNTLALMADGRILIGGDFDQFSSFRRGNIARLAPAPGTASPGSFQVVHSLYQVEEGAFNVEVQVRRLQGWDGAVSVSYRTVDGSASSASDYVATSGVLNWGPGDSSLRTITIPISGDAIVEADETFTLVLHSPVNGALDDISAATIVILNDDPGILNLDFDPEDGVLGRVMDLEIQTDGKVVIGGDFGWVWRASRNRVARLNPDGSLDLTFNPGTGANSTVNQVAVQPDGKILIAGHFTTVNGVGRSYLARFESNGSLDADFNPGINGQIEAMTLLPDGKILIGGNFLQVNGEARGHVARLNANGSLDLGFGPVAGISGGVNALVQQPDGKTLVGGSLSLSFGGLTYYYLIRLNANGTLETTFNPHNPSIGVNINSTVEDVVLQPDGKILIGGSFTSVAQQTRWRIARLNSNATLDTTFDPGSGANNTVQDVELQSDGRVLIAGDFTQFQGAAQVRVARLNANGSLDSTLDPQFGPNATVRVVKKDTINDAIFIGGDFTSFNSFLRVGVARLSGTGLEPALSMNFTGGSLVISWPVSATGYFVEGTPTLENPNWQPVPEPVVVQGSNNVVTIIPSGGARYFRLHHP